MSYAPIRSEPNSNHEPFATAASTLRKALFKKSSRARSKTLGRKSSSADFPLIVHSHLRWDWVWQRPQQFISRLSRRHKVLFVETLAPAPDLAAPLARFRTAEGFPNLTILSLQFPAWTWADGAYVDAERRRLVQEFLAGPPAGQFEAPVQWFYDPMAVPAFSGQMNEILTVYDCMDELSRFRFAPLEIVARERELLARADVVFTGGRKLFEAKNALNPNCHCYGCGVEIEHFGRARDRELPVPAEIAALPKPVFGYFGVVDERLDYDLLAALADATPAGSLAIVGPLMKVSQESMPQRPNLHWLGQRAYADLPALAKAFDVCLMPFALNEATEFINPTKALEYMATGRPIVSTAVPDVVRQFAQVVQIAGSSDDFIRACSLAVQKPNQTAIERGLQLASENSWDSIVDKLERHILDAIQNRCRDVGSVASSPVESKRVTGRRQARARNAASNPLSFPGFPGLTEAAA